MIKENKLRIAYLGIVISIVYLIVVLGFITTGLSMFLVGMEIVTIFSAPILLLIIQSIVIDSQVNKIFFKQLSIISISCSVVLTTVVHFINLTITQPLINKGFDVPSFLQIGQWPSLSMAIDYLAWGLFVGLAFIFVSLTISNERNKIKLRFLILTCGCLCLLGFLGPILNIIALWYIAVIGYGLGTPIICLQLLYYYRKGNI